MVRGAGLEPSFLMGNWKGKLREFEDFCLIDKNFTNKVIRGHIQKLSKLFEFSGDKVSKKHIRIFLYNIKNTRKIKTYSNYLCSFKRFFGDFLSSDIMDSFDFPRIPPNVVMVPSKKELQKFFYALPECKKPFNAPKYKALFLLSASSGLRHGELQSLRRKDVNLKDRMLIPKTHITDRTKRSWISFYTSEADDYLDYLTKLSANDKAFPIRHCVDEAIRKAKEKTRLNINLQILRKWFCCEMGELSVPDRYIDAFCGRVPRSVLARHYTDYSPLRLKRIYDKAGLKVLS